MEAREIEIEKRLCRIFKTIIKLDACYSVGIFFVILFFLASTPVFMQTNDSQNYYAERAEMVRSQIEARGIKSDQVLKAMLKVPRHLFVPENMVPLAYFDRPLPIGYDQTISQPYIVAFMSEALDVNPGDKVLEIGTGSGYQAAILAEMGMEVFSMEIVPQLATLALENLQKAGYEKVNVKCGNGYKGWPEKAPFDAIIITAAPPKIPQTLIDQLKIGGVMIVPVGRIHTIQYLQKVVKKEQGIKRTTLIPVRFVPMIKSYL
jgi:protein-L-isoaspartate(D-aspartate) O-methyltransferase